MVYCYFFVFFNKLKVPFLSQAVMVWGGLRGAVTLALALSLSTNLDFWWIIQSMAFGVVMFSLFVQTPAMSLLVNKLLKKLNLIRCLLLSVIYC